MSETYRIFGSELSPYSVKVRSYFRYKNIPHQWLPRNPANMAEFQKYAKLPLVPLVITPDGRGLQDSTPIIEALEDLHLSPSIHPGEAAAAFASALLEEYGDEWVNKPMFHYRWSYEPDQISTAERIAATALGASGEALVKASAQVRERMVSRLHVVGSSAATRPVIEASLANLLSLLERHLDGRDYLFGGRPAFGDFGLSAQLYEMSTDPTPGAIMRQNAPRTLAWCERMLDPAKGGPFEAWAGLQATLMPILQQQVAALFLPWSVANAKAVTAGEESFTADLAGQAFSQGAVKYHARSLQALRQRYQDLAPDARGEVDAALADSGCLPYLG
ncbi:MAG: glutathione S-transferase [Proteobacteria bacterium]|nr:glutathione S-transferase [Pseudomonadota bacterium]